MLGTLSGIVLVSFFMAKKEKSTKLSPTKKVDQTDQFLVQKLVVYTNLIVFVTPSSCMVNLHKTTIYQ